MHLAVEDNPNCPGAPEQVFAELGPRQVIRGIWVDAPDGRRRMEVTAVEEGGNFTPARAVKITDSSEGHAFLIYGGAWGVRLRFDGPWDLADPHQIGEPFKIYGDEQDILYADR